MQLNVGKVSQMASGGSHVVICEADLELLREPHTVVEVDRVQPPDSDPELIEMARLAILRGAEHVLGPRGQGATIKVRRLVINPIDFKPDRFMAFTAEELERHSSHVPPL
ncbi:hypothetical protein [Montanilutibacter psychrotolerans]|uniref:hypothetical protein n=1 Tax=Montanilutibacter psychrotolerans TaxID=1327343 RepID=UPI0011CE6DE1|nr:hypothetical protein [Lysobacter psychrotolerans]